MDVIYIMDFVLIVKINIILEKNVKWNEIKIALIKILMKMIELIVVILKVIKLKKKF